MTETLSLTPTAPASIAADRYLLPASLLTADRCLRSRWWCRGRWAHGPRFPGGCPPSTSLGAGGGHDRVRDGSGWFSAAFAHARRPRPHRPRVLPAGLLCGVCCGVVGSPIVGDGGHPACRTLCKSAFRPCAPLRSDACTPSTRGRSTRWSAGGLMLSMEQAGFISRWGSDLDALSGSPIPTWLPGGAALATTGTPAVGPARSSRTRASAGQPPSARGG